MRLFILLCLFCYSLVCCAKQPIVNVYIWGGEIPDTVIRDFEKETGITVNLSNYDSNETLYTKLKMMHHTEYDVVMPSGYFVDRMRKQQMLQRLDLKKLSNLHHLDPFFLKRDFDPTGEYGVPLTWGITGIIVNQQYYDPRNIKKWSDLWQAQYKHQLLLLDDMREVFAMALLTLGYSANDENPQHIKQAYQKLLELSPNIKLYAADVAEPIYVDEDAHLGMIWNGGAFKIRNDNKNLHFVYPEEGFVIWVDNLAIPKGAPHLENAYRFINYMLRPEAAELITIRLGFASTNLTAKKFLPVEIGNNPMLYPVKSILSRGQFQADISDKALVVYQMYWQWLKLH